MNDSSGIKVKVGQIWQATTNHNTAYKIVRIDGQSAYADDQGIEKYFGPLVDGCPAPRSVWAQFWILKQDVDDCPATMPSQKMITDTSDWKAWRHSNFYSDECDCGDKRANCPYHR